MKVLAAVLLMVVSGLAQCPKVIDDFTQGRVNKELEGPDQSVTLFQSAPNALGGVREEFYRNIIAEPLGQEGQLNIGRGHLTLSSGVREFFRIDLIYGHDLAGNLVPLHLRPAGCDRFRVTFDSSSRVVNFNIVVFTPEATGGLAHFQAGTNVDASPSTLPFCVDFPFAKFAGVPGQTHDFAATGIDLMDVIFQSGSAIGANDFAVTRIEVIDGTDPAVKPCTFSAD
jgi:hypothetical protein